MAAPALRGAGQPTDRREEGPTGPAGIGRDSTAAQLRRDREPAVDVPGGEPLAGPTPAQRPPRYQRPPAPPARLVIPVVRRRGAPTPGTDTDSILPWSPGPRWAPVPRRAVRKFPDGTRQPLVGLLGLLAFALLGTFFGWVSAGPAWLTLGHGQTATAAVIRCTGQGIAGRCTADVTGAGLDAAGLRLVGTHAKAGQRVPVQVVNDSAEVAYAGTGTGLGVRAVLGLLLVLACGVGAVWATGASRLPRRGRLVAVAGSFAVPLLLALGVFVTAY